MKNILPSFIISFFSFNFLIHSKSETKLLSILPKDTVFLFEVDDLEELGESIKSGPLGEFSESKAWLEMRKWAEVKIQGKAGSDSEKIEIVLEQMKEWFNSISGGMVFAVSNMDKILSRELPDFSLLIETDFTQEKLEDSLKWIKKRAASSDRDFSWETESISGKKVHWIRSDRDRDQAKKLAIVLFDKILGVFIGGEDYLRDSLFRSVEKSPSMMRNDNYLDLFEEIDRGSVRMFINFEPLENLIEDAKSVADMQIPENPFGITTSNLISAIGLDSIQCLGMQIDPSDEKLVLSTAFFMGKYDGIFSFIQHEDEGQAVQHDFISIQAFTANSVSYDFAKIWPTLEKMIAGLSPQLLLLVNSQIQAFEEKAEVAFRRDVLGTLGDEAFSFSLLPDKIERVEDFEKGSDFLGISLTDSKLFDRSLRSMIDSIAPGNDLFAERLHKGVTIRKLRGLEESGVSLSYAVTEKWFLLAMGEDNQLNQVINRMGGKGRSLWEKKEIQTALADLPEGSNTIDFVDLEKLVRFLSSVAIMTLDLEEEIKLKKTDFPTFPYFLVAWSKYVKRGFIGKAELYRKSN